VVCGSIPPKHENAPKIDESAEGLRIHQPTAYFLDVWHPARDGITARGQTFGPFSGNDSPGHGTSHDNLVLADLRIKVLKLSRLHLLMLATLRQSSFGQSDTHRTKQTVDLRAVVHACSPLG
jgi:hypothetical protein